jgi:hypothetical protein
LAPTKEAPGRGRAPAPPLADATVSDDVPEETYYRQVFDDFVELKRKCGESTDGLTYEKFSLKLKQNKEQLVSRYACKAVKFQVYVKDGKAALKATPVKS